MHCTAEEMGPLPASGPLSASRARCAAKTEEEAEAWGATSSGPQMAPHPARRVVFSPAWSGHCPAPSQAQLPRDIRGGARAKSGRLGAVKAFTQPNTPLDWERNWWSKSLAFGYFP